MGGDHGEPGFRLHRPPGPRFTGNRPAGPGDVPAFGREPTGLDDATLADYAYHCAGTHPDAAGTALTGPIRSPAVACQALAPAQLQQRRHRITSCPNGGQLLRRSRMPAEVGRCRLVAGEWGRSRLGVPASERVPGSAACALAVADPEMQSRPRRAQIRAHAGRQRETPDADSRQDRKPQLRRLHAHRKCADPGALRAVGSSSPRGLSRILVGNLPWQGFHRHLLVADVARTSRQIQVGGGVSAVDVGKLSSGSSTGNHRSHRIGSVRGPQRDRTLHQNLARAAGRSKSNRFARPDRVVVGTSVGGEVQSHTELRRPHRAGSRSRWPGRSPPLADPEPVGGSRGTLVPTVSSLLRSDRLRPPRSPRRWRSAPDRGSAVPAPWATARRCRPHPGYYSTLTNAVNPSTMLRASPVRWRGALPIG